MKEQYESQSRAAAGRPTTSAVNTSSSNCFVANDTKPTPFVPNSASSAPCGSKAAWKFAAVACAGKFVTLILNWDVRVPTTKYKFKSSPITTANKMSSSFSHLLVCLPDAIAAQP